jgi:hypothetical protein
MRKVGFAALNRYGGATTDSADFTDQVLNRTGNLDAPVIKAKSRQGNEP